MQTVYLVDYLGVHCGMHYYLEAFKKELCSIQGLNVEVISNYTDKKDKSPFFINQYVGPTLKKGISLLRNLYRFRRLVSKHQDDIFIYLTYGNSIDLFFMRIVAKARWHIIDIHEAIAQNLDQKDGLKNKFRRLYNSKIKAVISHSTRTDDFLKEYGCNATYFSVPHFRYRFPKEYDESQISDDIKFAPDKGKINLLFFGNLNESKGVDILIEAVNLLSIEDARKVNVIIAGKDFDGAVDRVVPKSDRRIALIRRHISDDELRFLYQNVDYLCLPYRKTSQSGILEMAFYFKKPIIASDITYFRLTINQFPSFGILAGNDVETYSKTLSKAITEHNTAMFFTPHDYECYENRSEIKAFLSEFKRWLD